MSRQYKRVATLIIGNEESVDIPNALKISSPPADVTKSGLRIDFKIEKDILGTPNPALIRVYNLSENSRSKIETEFTKIILNAGYEGNEKLLFAGDILYVFHKKTGTDIITEIYAGDAQKSYLQSFFSKTYSSDATYEAIITDVAKSFEQTSLGVIADIPNLKNSEFGSSFHDASHKVLNDLTEKNILNTA